MKSACVPEFNTMLRGFHTGSVLFKDIEVEIQQMGESITEGTIAEILKKEGDSVNEDETIAQIETDKVTIDVKAPSSGTLKSIKVRLSCRNQTFEQECQLNCCLVGRVLYDQMRFENIHWIGRCWLYSGQMWNTSKWQWWQLSRRIEIADKLLCFLQKPF